MKLLSALFGPPQNTSNLPPGLSDRPRYSANAGTCFHRQGHQQALNNGGLRVIIVRPRKQGCDDAERVGVLGLGTGRIDVAVLFRRASGLEDDSHRTWSR